MSIIATKRIINQTYQKWTETFSSYPADTYTCRIAFFKDAENKFTIEGVADGTDFEFTLDPSAEPYQGKKHGRYSYQIIATKNSEDFLVEQNTKTFLPNLEKDEDPRLEEEIMLEQVKAALMRLNNQEAKSVNVLGMDVTYDERAKLVQEAKRLEAVIKRKQGIRVNRNIGVKFY